VKTGPTILLDGKRDPFTLFRGVVVGQAGARCSARLPGSGGFEGKRGEHPIFQRPLKYTRWRSIPLGEAVKYMHFQSVGICLCDPLDERHRGSQMAYPNRLINGHAENIGHNLWRQVKIQN
jgi:hypothetical protein